MFRIPLILAVFLALTCTAIAAAADNPTTPTVSQRADGRHSTARRPARRSGDAHNRPRPNRRPSPADPTAAHSRTRSTPAPPTRPS